MKIKIMEQSDGTVICEVDCDTRHYRSRYRGYTRKEAKSKFTRRVLKAEQEEMDKVRLESLLMCLECKQDVSKCKGTCTYKPKNGKRLPRGKGATI